MPNSPFSKEFEKFNTLVEESKDSNDSGSKRSINREKLKEGVRKYLSPFKLRF